MLWPLPTRKRGKEASDAAWQELSHSLWALREHEAAGRVAEHRRLLKALTDQLLRRKDFVKDGDMWRELYFRSIYQYPHTGCVRTPVCASVTKHNHVVKFYMQEMHRVPGDAVLVHFDSHADTNSIPGSAALPSLYAANTEKAQQQAQDLVWDIGAAVSGVLQATGARPFVWCRPQWIPDPDFRTEYWIGGGSATLSMSAVAPPKQDRARTKALGGAFTLVKRKPAGTPAYPYAEINMSRPSADARLLECIPGGSFILDVDLDFFVCNGKQLEPSYWKEAYDVASSHRVGRRELIENPRDVFLKSGKEYLEYSRAVGREIRLIDGRLAAFSRTLRFLKRNGKRPVLLTISDSTGAEFTSCRDCATACNAYVPVHLALWVHTRVAQILERVFG